MERRFAAYQARIPALAAEFARRMAGELPADFDSDVAGVRRAAGREGRDASPRARRRSRRSRRYAPALPEMIGGSADLTGSVFTNWSGSEAGRRATQPGNYVNFGVREFGDERDRQRPRACTAASSRTSARSSRSPTTRAMRCAWRR